MSEHVEPGGGRELVSSDVLERRLPPVAELLVLSVALMLAGGVYLAAHLPHPPPLEPAIVLVAAGAVSTIVAVALLSRIRPFAWGTFSLVARWAFLAYVVIAGLLGFVFVFDHTHGAALGVLVVTLLVFALDVPAVIAFTVARYEAVDADGSASIASGSAALATEDS